MVSPQDGLAPSPSGKLLIGRGPPRTCARSATFVHAKPCLAFRLLTSAVIEELNNEDKIMPSTCADIFPAAAPEWACTQGAQARYQFGRGVQGCSGSFMPRSEEQNCERQSIIIWLGQG
jgi:hypothetical protein